MSAPQPPSPAWLVVSLLLADRDLYPAVAQVLIERFGAVARTSDWLDFDYTDYYRREMGAPLVRRMMVFESLIDQGRLPDIKLATNDMEQRFALDARRRVNIDPGYLVAERFVLATGKNFTHRIYLDKGIYADLTLIYTKGAFQKLPWTFPDYADLPIRRFLESVRKQYMETRSGKKLP